jgi:chromosome segregation protein
MHLRALKLRGFKSFPDPVELRFEPGVAVIVGPNGSGKSNVSDAIVWASGSLTPSELRAEKPDDVLFVGSSGREATDSCEVELVFDNSAGDGPLEFGELAVTRRLHRGGEGQYLVNRAHVRRLDLVDILSDLGLGDGMHSVISQGRVEEMLSARPEERRALVEEAAGLGRFKRRRHRAELKLARVQSQVERARDVEQELRKRLRPLALQASAAERAERLRAQIAALLARIAQLDLAAAQARRAETEQRRLEAAEGQERARLELEGLLDERERAEQELADATGGREERLAALYRLRSALERLALREESLQAVAGELAGQLETERSEARHEEAERLERELEEARRLATAAEAEAERLESQSRALWGELATIERAGCDSLARELAEVETRRVALGERLASEAAGPQRASQALVELRSLQERLCVRAESIAQLTARAQSRLEEAKALAGRTGPSPAELERAAREAAARAREALLARDRLAELEADARERLRALERSLAEREGIPPAARALAEAGERLALSLLEVEPGYEQAVAAALGWRAAAVVAGTPRRALDLLERARREGLGTLAVLLPAPSSGQAPPVAGAEPLAARVRGDGSVGALLADVWVVERERLLEATSGIAVTREGHGYEPARGELRFWGETAEALLLELETRRRSLAEALERLRREHAEAEAKAREAERARVEAAEAFAAVEHLLGRRHADPALLAELVSAGARFQATAEATEGRAQALERSLRAQADTATSAAELVAELRALADRESELRAAQTEAERLLLTALRRAGAEEVEAAASEIEGRGPALRDGLARLDEAVSLARVGGAEALSRSERLERSLAALAPRRRGQIERQLAQRLAGSAERLATTLAGARAGLERFELSLRAAVEQGACRVGELAAELRRLGAAEVGLRQVSSEAGERGAAIGVELARIDAELADAQRRLVDAGAEPAEGDDRSELTLRLERSGRKLEELGRVNPLAKEEYEAEKARLDELMSQRADLELSLRELERLRAELTETVERRFSETFSAVSANFEEVAGLLFPGGQGRLRLTEPEDEEGEVGIEVELQPAGKKATKLSLLSGGEKALGAIAFLFALFLARPCPFYLLDEVEAALDDTNIGRFVDLLRRFAERAQFIVITHQKRTMEAADVLYGVTMGGDGVSQVVSRRVPRQVEEPALAG